MKKIIDLRSDTVTKPSPQMRQIMAAAEVGDDVFCDDPTVIKLEQKVAQILGKEAALFVPSGTMANQISLRVLCNPGDEAICERKAHIVFDEVAAAAALSGIMLRPIDGENGKLSPEQVYDAYHQPDIHRPYSRVVALENTHNRAGGKVLGLDYINKIASITHELGLGFYLDGARLWNAAIALKTAPAQIAAPFDMVSVCFSKGLGAPIGSAVTGSRENIQKARRIRKMFGGGMRQVGIIASAALFALETNYKRLQDDHDRAKKLASGLTQIEGIHINPQDIQTNIVIFRIEKPQAKFLQKMADMGVLMVAFGKDLVRAVVHLDIAEEDISIAVSVVAQAIKEC
jgi:threonine aldolase